MSSDRIFTKAVLGKLSIFVTIAFLLLILTPSLQVSAEDGIDGSETESGEFAAGFGNESVIEQEETAPSETDSDGITQSSEDPIETSGDEMQPDPGGGETSASESGESDPGSFQDTTSIETTSSETGDPTQSEPGSGEPDASEPQSSETSEPTEPELGSPLALAAPLALEATINYGDPSASLMGFNGGVDGGGGWTTGNLGKTYAEGEWVPYQLVLTGVQTAWGPGLDGMSQYDGKLVISYDFTNGGHRFIDMVKDLQVGTVELTDSQAYPDASIGSREELETAQNDLEAENVWGGFTLLKSVSSFEFDPQINDVLPGDPDNYTVDRRTIVITQDNLVDAGLDEADTIVIYFQLHLSRTLFWRTNLHTSLATNPLTIPWGGYKYGSPDANHPYGSGYVSGSSGHIQLETFGNKTVPLPVPAEPPGAISGTKWLDVNGDGDRDAEDTGLSDWTIHATITYGGVTFTLDTTTGGDGHYSFPDMSYADWEISESVQPGYEQTYPHDSSGNPINWDVTLDADHPSVSSIDFGNFFANPSLNVEKSSTTTLIDHAGQVVPYTFVVTNTGNVALTGITVTDPNVSPAPAYVSGDANSNGKLDLTETWTYSGSHTVTQAEVDSNGGGDGDLDNTVTADSNETGPATDDLAIPISRTPGLNVVKSSTTILIDHAGQVVSYTFVVTNTGNVTLTGITVTDSNLDAAAAYVSGDTNSNNKLDLTETWTYSGNHTVTQAEIDSNGGGDGDLDNTVTADSNETGPDTDDLAIPISRTPGLNVVKSSTTTLIDHADQVVPYTFVVTNTGNVTLTGITVTDLNVSPAPAYASGDTNSNGQLDVGESWTYTGNHTVLQLEINNNGGGDGDLDNTVTADSNETGPDTDDYAIPIRQGPALNVVKSSTTTLITSAGQVVPYTFVVTNTGNVSLTGITVTDPNCTTGPTYSSGDIGMDGILDVGEAWTYSGSHTVTQAEIDSNGGGDGDLDNTVTADSNETGPETDDHFIPISRTPGLNVAKSSTTTLITAAGQIVPYTFIVTNTGNVTLTGITVSDPNVSPAPAYASGDTNSNGLLDVGESWTYTGSHTVTQAEIDTDGGGDGDLDNTVTADSNETGPDTDDLAIPIDQNPALDVVKNSTTILIDHAGQVVPYTFTVYNTGNVTLTGITVSDPNCDADPVLDVGDLNHNGLMEVTEIWIFTGSHTVTQEEIDSNGGGDGDLDNTVTADSNETGPDTDDHFINIGYAADLEVEKTSTTTLITAAGQVVPYTFVVRNTGNVSLTGITVTDPNCTTGPTYSSGDLGLDGILDVGEAWTYTGSHTVTQAEMDSNGDGDGDLDNTVTADSNETGPATDDLAIPISRIPGLNVVKSSTTILITAAGQSVPYTFVVTNTGNVTLTGITVSDPNLDAAAVYVSGDANSNGKLDLTETWTYSGSHTVTQAEIDTDGGGDGDLDNTVTADSNETGPDTDIHAIQIEQSPGLNVVKSSTTILIDEAGQVVPYTFLVTNTGNMTLTGISVTDPNVSPAPAYVSGDNGNNKLDVGESWTFAGNHTVTQFELDGNGGGDGDLDNTVTADSNETDPDTDIHAIPIAQIPGLSVEKSSATTLITAAGQVVPYTFVVRNTGNVSLTGITVMDPDCDIGPSYSSGDIGLDGILDVNEAWTYTGSHIVTQAEIDSNGGGDGDLDNTVTADSNETSPDTDDHEISIGLSPALSVEKTSTTTLITTVGQVVPYTFTVVNKGNVVLTNITVTDPICTVGPTYSSGDTNDNDKLDVGETWIFTGSHTVTLAEITAAGTSTEESPADGWLDNTVIVDSTETEPESDEFSIPVNAPPSIDIAKFALDDSVDDPGDEATFMVVIVNTSLANDPVTITSLTDSIEGGPAFSPLLYTNATLTTPITLPQTILPGASLTVYFEASIDGDRGENIDDIVTVSGTDDEQTPVSDSDGADVDIDTLPPPPTTTPAPTTTLAAILDVFGAEMPQTGDLSDAYPFKVIGLMTLLLAGTLLILWKKRENS